MIVVADTSPLLHLARIGRLGLIPAGVGPVVVPASVWNELLRAGTRVDVAADIGAAAWITVSDDPPVIDLGLDPGETAAILLAESLGADALIIDERRGRRVAKERGLGIIGTLGIVASARRAGAIEKAAPILDALRADGFWLSEELVARYLADLGEGPEPGEP